MKVAIIYFSLDGNTRYVAEQMAEQLNADIIPLKPLKDYPTGKFSKFFWGGKSAVFAEKPELEKYDFNADAYDLIILGTPVWAGTFTPPLRTFISGNDLRGKKVALFACNSGGDAEECFSKITKLLPDCKILSTQSFFDPKDQMNEESKTLICAFCRKIEGEL